MQDGGESQSPRWLYACHVSRERGGDTMVDVNR